MEETLSQVLIKQSQRKKIFIINPASKEKISFYDFYVEAKQISRVIARHGAKKGDCTAIFMENGIGYAAAFFGVTFGGQTAVPVNFSYKAKEFRYVLEDAKVKFILTTRQILKEKEAIFREICSYQTEDLGSRELVLLILDAKVDGTEETGKRYQEETNVLQGEDLALILYTSGTTGNPKGVMLTHKNLLAEAQNVKTAHNLKEEDIVLSVLPLFHINGLVITLITPLVTGMEIIMPPKFSASNFWKWVDRYKVTWLNAVPTIYSILLTHDVDKTLDTSSLRFARSASSSLPLAVLKEFENRYQIPMIESFGISEGGSQITSNPLPPQKRKPGSVGLAYGNEVAIFDEKDQVLSARETGEIVVRGDNIAKGYLNKEKETKEAFRDGWFHTGDMGYLDEEGYLYINGRKKELINRAGEKFSPKEIDEVLYQLPQVELAAAVGVPNPLYNEEVVAYLKLRDGQSLTEEEVKRHCKEKLADFKMPKEIFFTNDFPKGPSGKIQRLKFIERYLENHNQEKGGRKE